LDIEAAGVTAARRTCGVSLKREGFNLRHIREMLGPATPSAANALREGDSVDHGHMVARVI